MKHSNCQFGDYFWGFGRQNEKFSRIGTCIRHNFTPCLIFFWTVQSVSTVGLQLEAGERLVKEFPSSSSLWDVLLHWDVNEKRLGNKALTKLKSAVTKCTVGNLMYLLAYTEWSKMKLGHQCHSHIQSKTPCMLSSRVKPLACIYIWVLCH